MKTTLYNFDAISLQTKFLFVIGTQIRKRAGIELAANVRNQNWCWSGSNPSLFKGKSECTLDYAKQKKRGCLLPTPTLVYERKIGM